MIKYYFRKANLVTRGEKMILKERQQHRFRVTKGSRSVEEEVGEEDH